jgi:outer membrane protein assembly factor BamD (BamD/ComL family)
MQHNMTSQPPAAGPSSSPIDSEVFWLLHKQKILIGAALLLLTLLGFAIYLGFQTIQTQKAEQAYATADSIDAWRAVIRQFPGSMAAGNASLRIAMKLRDDRKYPESDSAYEAFVRDFPKHPLVVDGYMGRAANAELENNPDKALEQYREVTTRFPNTYQAPMALFHQGRLTETKGQLKEAQQLFERVVQRYSNSVAAIFAEQEAGKLNDRLAPAAGPNPAASPNVQSSVNALASPSVPASASPGQK